MPGAVQSDLIFIDSFNPYKIYELTAIIILFKEIETKRSNIQPKDTQLGSTGAEIYTQAI